MTELATAPIADDTVSIAQVYELLERVQRQQARERNTILNQARRIEDLERQWNRSVQAIETAFGLRPQAGHDFQAVVEGIIRQIADKESGAKSRIEQLEAEETRTAARIKDLEAEINGAIANLVQALELPPHRSRTLINAVGEAILLILDAKLLFQEHE